MVDRHDIVVRAREHENVGRLKVLLLYHIERLHLSHETRKYCKEYPILIVYGASGLEGNVVIYDVENHRELSLDPGGEKFQAEVDYSMSLVGVILLALIGLVNAIWIATATTDELKAKDASWKHLRRVFIFLDAVR
ncbi:hypothetical protein PsorP6_009048 [Peronosclerospora sorghi]|uniref:Uncharacterized protein n=1 Tax=Peronosclerospora sorghi TaxID=230839 RepID=A0ACC0W0I0_9STRA|nr:hypothetical protein PsorP6_009048 [Peronosclerospora sorghi]